MDIFPSMPRSRNSTSEPTGFSSSSKGRLVLFTSLLIVALVDAMPAETVERKAIEIGQGFCEASATGRAGYLAMSRSFPNVVVIGTYLAGRLQQQRDRFRRIARSSSVAAMCRLRPVRGVTAVPIIS